MSATSSERGADVVVDRELSVVVIISEEGAGEQARGDSSIGGIVAAKIGASSLTILVPYSSTSPREDKGK